MCDVGVGVGHLEEVPLHLTVVMVTELQGGGGAEEEEGEEEEEEGQKE